MMSKPPAMYARQRTGLTLVELLVAMAVTMIMVAGIARFFKYVGDTVAEGRALMELTGEIHGVRASLDRQLSAVTADFTRRSSRAAGQGYLEIIEGDLSDASTLGTANQTFFGDVDDVIAFTVRSKTTPFRGQLLYNTVSSPSPGVLLYSLAPPAPPAVNTGPKVATLESHTAEVVYWLTLDDKNGNGVRDYGEYYVLRRRILLIRPDIQLDATYSMLSYPNGFNPTSPSNPVPFSVFNIADLSLRRVGNQWVTNDLDDLARRENRFGRTGSAFPHLMLAAEYLPRLKDIQFAASSGGGSVQQYNVYRRDEDIVLSHVVAFDVQVFDPQITTRVVGNEIAVAPSDPGYAQPATEVASGAYADLGHGFGTTILGQRSWLRNGAGTRLKIFDTWSTSYDRDGIDQFNDGQIDTGSDGVDNNGNGITDEAVENEVPPPYPTPLRGIRITVRTIDPSTRQVAQAVVSADFTPW